jgi:hypothetical protein
MDWARSTTDQTPNDEEIMMGRIVGRQRGESIAGQRVTIS